MGIGKFIKTFNLSPTACRQLESWTVLWPMQAWLRLGACFAASPLLVILYVASVYQPNNSYLTGPLLVTLSWAFANLSTIFAMHMPMPTGANMLMDIIASLSLSVILVLSAIAATVPVKSEYVDLILITMLIAATTFCQIAVTILGGLTCHRLRKEKKKLRLYEDPVAPV